MKPLKLIVRAFGPYAAEQAFDFADLKGRSFFLIHGPTGAGKTSVLDALCFALYGQASGSLRGVKHLRSDHADAKTLTEVVYDFALGEERYRIRRAPEQERPKKKGTGTTLHEPEATLWRRTHAQSPADEGNPLADGWADVNDHVQRLMGFQADQFRQVVMLPQGQFQRLLTAKSDERQGILEALFDVAGFGRIEAALKEAAAAARRRVEDARRGREETLRAGGAASAEQLAARRESTAAELGAARDKAAGMRIALAGAREASATGSRAAEKLRERDDAARAVGELQGRAGEMAAKAAAHAAARLAAGLADAEASLRQRQIDAGASTRKLAAARADAARADDAKQQADAALACESSRDAARGEARLAVGRLSALEGKVLELDQARARTRLAAEAVARRTVARDAAGAALEKVRAGVAASLGAMGKLQSVACQTQSLQVIVRAAEKAVKHHARLKQAAVELDAAEIRAGEAAEKLASYGAQVAAARQALKELEAAWRGGQAALLAAALADGSPCPVCGSSHHPQPAASRENPPAEKAVNARRQSVEAMELSLGSLREASARARQDAAEWRATARALRENLGEQSAVGGSDLEQAADAARANLEWAEAAGIELTGASTRLAQLRGQESLAASLLAEADAALNEAAAQRAACRAVAVEREAGVPESVRDGAGLGRELSAAKRRLSAMEDAIAAAGKAAAEAGAAAAAAGAALTAAAESAEAAGRHASELSLAFERRFAEAGFADAAAYQAAKLAPQQIDALEREVSRYQVDLQSARERLDRAAAGAEGLAEPDLAALQAAAARAEAALEGNVRREEDLARQLRQFDDALARLRQLDEELRQSDARYEVVGQIAEVAGGKNDYRMTFQRYVLGVFLDEVLYAATQRLSVMSRGRFLLQRSKDAAGGRAAGGLDLEVQDAHTGTTRPAGTLSGGESFLASLSLALGLADVVQSYAGGIRLETMFVDEGFGSLDPEFLDLALRALRDLQQGGRLVGIISHVAELREWIDARLEVTTGRRGSVARFCVT